jgi:LacI family transcriptional regulator
MAGKRVTVVEIANAAGVSKSTVSLVLQGSPLVRSDTRQRVNSTIKDLGYIYNRSAANLRQSNAKSKIIGVIVNDLTNSFFAELAVGIDSVVQSAGYVQFLSSSSENLDRQQELISSMREHGISGLIICPARGSKAADLNALSASGIPVVAAVRNVPGAKVSTLMSDNQTGIRQATEYLIGLGHRRIAFLGGFTDTAVFIERSNEFRRTMINADLQAADDHIVSAPPSRAGGFLAIQRALASPERPTAAVCLNDAVAFGVCDGLRAFRMEPGKEFAVVGFDDVIEAQTAVPALTTVSVDPQGMGRRAAHLLLKKINSGDTDNEALMTSVRLVRRQSCGEDFVQVDDGVAA